MAKENQSNQLSESLLLAVKQGTNTQDFVQALKSLSLDQLKKELNSDVAKKAFWINCYNAFFLILRKEKQLGKSEIYRKKEIEIAGQQFSLDDIEHGILRRYRYKFSLGYFVNPFASRLVKSLAVQQIDYRIHFALNCGAESCPPIAFYNVEKLEQQLELASLSFLETETKVYPEKNEIHISRLFLWYLGDFGGKTGIRKILSEKLQIQTKAQKLIYRAYSWKEDLDNFVEDSFA